MTNPNDAVRMLREALQEIVMPRTEDVVQRHIKVISIAHKALDSTANVQAEEVPAHPAQGDAELPPAIPSAWFRGVQCGGSPEEPPEWDVEMHWGDYCPTHGKGWMPLYESHQPTEKTNGDKDLIALLNDCRYAASIVGNREDCLSAEDLELPYSLLPRIDAFLQSPASVDAQMDANLNDDFNSLIKTIIEVTVDYTVEDIKTTNEICKCVADFIVDTPEFKRLSFNREVHVDKLMQRAGAATWKFCGKGISLRYGSTSCGTLFHGSVMQCDECVAAQAALKDKP